MKTTVKYLIIAIVVFFVAVLASRSEAGVIELREVFIDYKNYALLSKDQRDLLTYPEPPKESINIGINTDLLWHYFYSDALIESTTVDSQYRGVGLQERLGVYIGKTAEFGWNHHSQHVLDRQMGSIPTFPTEDSLELKLYLYRR